MIHIWNVLIYDDSSPCFWIFYEWVVLDPMKSLVLTEYYMDFLMGLSDTFHVLPRFLKLEKNTEKIFKKFLTWMSFESFCSKLGINGSISGAKDLSAETIFLTSEIHSNRFWSSSFSSSSSFLRAWSFQNSNYKKWKYLEIIFVSYHTFVKMFGLSFTYNNEMDLI